MDTFINPQGTAAIQHISVEDYIYGGERIDPNRITPEKKLVILRRIFKKCKPQLPHILSHMLQDDPTLLRCVGGIRKKEGFLAWCVLDSDEGLNWRTRVGFLCGDSEVMQYCTKEKKPEGDEYTKSLFLVDDNGHLVEIRLKSLRPTGKNMIPFPNKMDALVVSDERLTELLVQYPCLFRTLRECLSAICGGKADDMEARARNVRGLKTEIDQSLARG